MASQSCVKRNTERVLVLRERENTRSVASVTSESTKWGATQEGSEQWLPIVRETAFRRRTQGIGEYINAQATPYGILELFGEIKRTHGKELVYLQYRMIVYVKHRGSHSNTEKTRDRVASVQY